jgi:hypothetical protein
MNEHTRMRHHLWSYRYRVHRRSQLLWSILFLSVAALFAYALIRSLVP